MRDNVYVNRNMRQQMKKDAEYAKELFNIKEPESIKFIYLEEEKKEELTEDGDNNPPDIKEKGIKFIYPE